MKRGLLAWLLIALCLCTGCMRTAEGNSLLPEENREAWEKAAVFSSLPVQNAIYLPARAGGKDQETITVSLANHTGKEISWVELALAAWDAEGELVLLNGEKRLEATVNWPRTGQTEVAVTLSLTTNPQPEEFLFWLPPMKMKRERSGLISFMRIIYGQLLSPLLNFFHRILYLMNRKSRCLMVYLFVQRGGLAHDYLAVGDFAVGSFFCCQYGFTCFHRMDQPDITTDDAIIANIGFPP